MAKKGEASVSCDACSQGVSYSEELRCMIRPPSRPPGSALLLYSCTYQQKGESQPGTGEVVLVLFWGIYTICMIPEFLKVPQNREGKVFFSPLSPASTQFSSQKATKVSSFRSLLYECLHTLCPLHKWNHGRYVTVQYFALIT